MGRKRKHESDDDELSGNTKKRKSCKEECESDESLHLPETIYAGEDISNLRKKEKRKHHKRLDGNDQGGPLGKAIRDVLENNDEHSDHDVLENNDEHTDTRECKSEPTQNQGFELYLIRKPVEVSTEDLSNSRIRIRSCLSKEQTVFIGDKCFVARGSKTQTQMFHIPAEAMQSSKNPWFTGVGSRVKGFVVLSRTDIYNSAHMSGEPNSTSNLDRDLPFETIRKKVSRKQFRNLKQRLCASGVKHIDE